MSAIKIQRYPPRNRGMTIGCGCLALLGVCALVTAVGALLLLPALPAITLRLAGFSPQGDTDAVFADSVPAPPSPIQNPVVPSQITIDLGSYGAETLAGNTRSYQIAVEESGQRATATFTESGLMELCRQMSVICSGGDSRYRNLRLDLRPGGGIIYADVTLPDFGLSQTVGVVLKLDSTRTQVEVAGVDIGGALYTAPPEGLGSMVSEFARVGNDILRQLTLQAGGGVYALSEVYIDDSSLTLFLQ